MKPGSLGARYMAPKVSGNLHEKHIQAHSRRPIPQRALCWRFGTGLSRVSGAERGFTHLGYRRGQEMDETTNGASKTGRPRSIPESAHGLVVTLYGQGLGYRAAADRLAEMRVCYPTKSSVERFIEGQSPYTRF